MQYDYKRHKILKLTSKHGCFGDGESIEQTIETLQKFLEEGKKQGMVGSKVDIYIGDMGEQEVIIYVPKTEEELKADKKRDEQWELARRDAELKQLAALKAKYES